MVRIFLEKLGQVLFRFAHQGFRVLGVICALCGGAQRLAHFQVPGVAELFREVVVPLEHVEIIHGHVAVALILKGVQKRRRPDLVA